MKYILITGCNGLIGKEVVNKLLKNQKYILGLSNEGEGFIKNKYFIYKQMDITNHNEIQELFNKYEIEAVIHLAALAHIRKGENYSREQLYNINYFASCNIFKCAIQRKVKILFSSTVDVYGRTENQLINENEKCNPISDYAKSKYLAEEYLRKEAVKSNFLYTIARIAPVYSKNSMKDVYKRIYIKTPLVAYLVGKGEQSFHFCSIHNITDFVYKWILIDKPPVGIINICDKEPISAKKLVELEKNIYKAKYVIYIPFFCIKSGFKLISLFGKRYKAFANNNIHKLLASVSWDNRRMISEVNIPKWNIESTIYNS